MSQNLGWIRPAGRDGCRSAPPSTPRAAASSGRSLPGRSSVCAVSTESAWPSAMSRRKIVVAKVARSLLDGLGLAGLARVGNAAGNAGVADMQRNFKAQRRGTGRTPGRRPPRLRAGRGGRGRPTAPRRARCAAARWRHAAAAAALPSPRLQRRRRRCGLRGGYACGPAQGSGFAIETNGTARRRCGGGWRHIYGSSRGTLVILRWLCESL